MGGKPSKKSIPQPAPQPTSTTPVPNYYNDYYNESSNKPVFEKPKAKSKSTERYIVPSYAFPPDIARDLLRYKYSKDLENAKQRHEMCRRVFSEENPFLFLLAIPDASKRARMLALLQDLAASEVPFNAAKATVVTDLHGYKSRESYGTGRIDLKGKFYFPRYLNNATDYINFEFNDEGYLEIFINHGPVITFVTCKGTQMDSGSGMKLLESLPPLGIQKDEIYAFLILVYQWIHYDVKLYLNKSSFCSYISLLPERIPDSMLVNSSYCYKKEYGIENPEWFIKNERLRDDDKLLAALAQEYLFITKKVLVFYLAFSGNALPSEVAGCICLLAMSC